MTKHKLSETIYNPHEKTKEQVEPINSKLDLLVDVVIDDVKKGEKLTLRKVLGETKKRKMLEDLSLLFEMSQQKKHRRSTRRGDCRHDEFRGGRKKTFNEEESPKRE